MNGTRWCSHMEYSGMSLTMTISSWPASKVTVRCLAGSSASPRKTSAYMRATRSGVALTPSRETSSPMAARISCTARSMRASSTVTRPSLGFGRRGSRGAAAPVPVAVGRLAGPRRGLADDLHQLRRVERLLLDQRGGQLVEHGPVRGEDVAGLSVGAVDERPDLTVDA